MGCRRALLVQLSLDKLDGLTKGPRFRTHDQRAAHSHIVRSESSLILIHPSLCTCIMQYVAVYMHVKTDYTQLAVSWQRDLVLVATPTGHSGLDEGT